MFLFSSGPTVQADATWFAAGLTSTFPETQDHAATLAQHRRCEALAAFKPGCKVFHVPREDPSLATEVDMTDTDFEAAEASSELKDQVLVFQYRGKFHAVDHICPHSSYPLSQGTPFDIEDFGVVLSSGLSCPKHGWSFDLFTGNADRATYKLTIWEVNLRAPDEGTPPRNVQRGTAVPVAGEDMMVWVRKKQRIG
ncbi:hypothetical protein VHEMI05387 [[Torrubiella] hemipterigena]|uniref:Rieske domain-containing protein n=1 Tax=[Torrubiella] hemipterigena TaxID=1531966 RepID=A0A0A1SXT2_9HYPO|nr:hypothetical protein VHEMI05387 [[Torrubiella] hemipterigena]